MQNFDYHFNFSYVTSVLDFFSYFVAIKQINVWMILKTENYYYSNSSIATHNHLINTTAQGSV